MKIYIDADGCPVVDETVAAAEKHGIECIIICDTSHRIERKNARTIVVDKGADSADLKLVNLLQKGDIAVTQDHGLAALCLGKGAYVLNQDGKEYTSENISGLLEFRAVHKKIRRSGGHLKGSPKRTAEQDKAFAEALYKIIIRNTEKTKKAVFHLPGLFEFYELYKAFLPIFYEHREWFYDRCEIGSIYGAPADCLWGGGRVGFGDSDPREVLALTKEYNISARLTFSNSLLQKEHLSDRKCNELCSLFEKSDPRSGVIIHSDILLEYLKANYPRFYFVSSTTKVLTAFSQFSYEVKRNDFLYVVPDFRLNKQFDKLNTLSAAEKDKVEFLCNECCSFGCNDRKLCYDNVSRKSLGESCPDHICSAPDASGGYLFSKAMKNPAFIGLDDIRNVYLPMGFSNFKIEGRGLGSALILEFLLYYLTKPEYQLQVREKIYLDSMLDLF